MPSPTSNNKRPKNVEKNVEDALAEYKFARKKPSLRSLARKHTVPYATLHFRMKRISSGESLKRRGRKQCLSAESEEEICNVIISMKNLGFPMTRSDIRESVYEYCKINNLLRDRFVAGRRWLTGFLKRHKLTARTAENLSVARAAGITKPVVEDFINNLNATFNLHGVAANPELIFNVDETGFQSVPPTQKVIAPAGSKVVFQQTSLEKGTTTTVIACVSASGTILPPLVIFKSRRSKRTGEMIRRPEWENGFPPGTIIEYSESGWVSSEIYLRWFKDILIEHCKRLAQKTVLIMDGHSSHKQVAVISLAAANGVQLVVLPPHTSSVLQPLDVGCFGPLKKAWYNVLRKHIRDQFGDKFKNDAFGELFTKAWESCNFESNAVAGFRHSGIFPVDPSRIHDDVYKPGQIHNISVEMTNENDDNAMETREAAPQYVDVDNFNTDDYVPNFNSGDHSNENGAPWLDPFMERSVSDVSESSRLNYSDLFPLLDTTCQNERRKPVSHRKRNVLKEINGASTSRIYNVAANYDKPNMRCIQCRQHWKDGGVWFQCQLCDSWLHEKCGNRFGENFTCKYC